MIIRAVAQSDQPIYTDSLQNGWNNWSWGSTIDFNSTASVHGGSRSIEITITSGWAALYLQHTAFNSSGYANLTFWVNGGASGGQPLAVKATTNGVVLNASYSFAPAGNTWQQITVPLSTLGVANNPNLDGVWIQSQSGSALTAFYVDDMTLTANANPSPTVTLTSPADGSSYAAPAGISLAATVVANGHTITKVQFYNGTSLLNEDTTAPYSYNWTGVGVGNYSLTARAIYDAGASVDSTAANVTVTGTAGVTINVDAQLNPHPISPLIYGVAFASSNQLQDLNAPLNRSGGNSETRYNWELNAHNHANDWYFESIADSPATPAASSDSFITDSKNGNAQPLITIPMIGWMPKLGPSRGKLASFSIAKYGPQTGNDWQWMPDAGNGISSPGGTNIVNDPNDANFLTNSAFQNAFVRHLTNRWGLSASGGVRYYIMDNEHSIWHSTHRDVHPVGATMEEIRDDMIEYASMVKSNDPNALVLGPEEFGWSGYLYSGYDLWYGNLHGWSYFPDRSAHGNMDYMPWLLSQLQLHDAAAGRRLLDCFTLHCYPEDGNVAGSATDTTTQLLRNRLTRKFWDTNYVDETWINDVVKLIPRMKAWVDAYYPGTKIGITEYNWGAEGHINGATAQADILGIFGREGLDLATRWTTPDASTPTYKAMKLYRNYDGSKSTFGDTSVSATAPNPDDVSAFAALRSSDGALTLMVINKQLSTSSALTVNLANFAPAGTAQVWQLTAANTIDHLGDVALSGNTLNTTVPAQSITLFVVAAGAITPPPPPVLVPPSSLSSSNTFNFWLTNGVAGQRYVIQSSSDLVTWLPVQTNTLGSSSNSYVFPAPDAMRFYRAQWAP
jgi:hypothetical protein